MFFNKLNLQNYSARTVRVLRRRRPRPITLRDFLPKGFVSSSDSEGESSEDVASEAQGRKDASCDTGKGVTSTTSSASDIAPATGPVNLSPEIQYLQKIRRAVVIQKPFGGTEGLLNSTLPTADPGGPTAEMLYLQRTRGSRNWDDPFGPFRQSEAPFPHGDPNPPERGPGSRLAVKDIETHGTEHGRGRGGGKT